MKESQYNHTININENEHLLYNAFTNALAVLNPEYLHILKNVGSFTPSQKKNDSQAINDLLKMGFLLNSDVDELSLLRHKYQQSKYVDKRLSLTLAPTLNCNFACTYCYEDNEKGKMSIETQLSIFQFIEKRISSIKDLRLTWYGGEPLLAKDIVFNFSKKLMQLCESHKVTLTILMISNGYLLDEETIDHLKDIELKQIQITLDGPPDIHNKRRPLVSGKGTFSRILANISKLRKAGVNTVIRVNIDKTNTTHIHRLLDILKDNGLMDIRVYLGHVIDENNNQVCDSYLNLQDFSDTVLKFNKALHAGGFIDSGNYPRQKMNYCGADHINSFVINHDGSLYKCWLDVGIKDMSFGNINALNLISLTKSVKYLTYNAFEYTKCKTCSILPVCMGGCPHAGLKDNDPSCDSMKYNLNDTIINYYNKLS